MKLQRSAATLATMAMLAAPMATHAATAFAPGDLIKGSGSTVYYFGQDGRRYVFPNDKTYFTWYTDFSKVKTIPDGQLSTIPLARQNVTYRPGKKMIKITTDPRTYVLERGGVMRHVGTEQLAESLYGLNWKNQIDDVPDQFFVNYKRGTPIQTVSDFQPANVMTLTTTISQDKSLDEMLATVTIGSKENGFVPSSMTVKKGSTITWTNNDNSEHSVNGTGFSSGKNLKYGESWSYTFNTTGSFDYSCGVHPVMQGSINVVN